MEYFTEVYIGNISQQSDGSRSAINKQRVMGELPLTLLGLEGDQQAEPGIHGGVDRALCHYPQEHYSFWQQQLPQQASCFAPAALGENLSTTGLTEQNVYIGDIFRWHEALIQVTQPRSPCYKLNSRFQQPDFSLLVQQSGYCGWLYRVIQPGRVGGEYPLQLLSRTSNLSVAQAIEIVFNLPFSADNYQQLLGAAGLSASWCSTLQRRLLTGQIESFNRRLFQTD